MKSLFVVLASSVFITACSSGGTDGISSDESERNKVPEVIVQSEKKVVFELDIPEGWEDITETVSSDFVKLFVEKEYEDGKLASINVVEESAVGFDLDSYTEISIDTLVGTMNDAVVWTNENIEVNGEAMKKIEYTANLYEQDLKFLVYIGFRDDNGYVVTSTFLEEEFDELSPGVEEILQTFRFVD